MRGRNRKNHAWEIQQLLVRLEKEVNEGKSLLAKIITAAKEYDTALLAKLMLRTRYKKVLNTAMIFLINQDNIHAANLLITHGANKNIAAYYFAFRGHLAEVTKLMTAQHAKGGPIDLAMIVQGCIEGGDGTFAESLLRKKQVSIKTVVKAYDKAGFESHAAILSCAWRLKQAIAAIKNNRDVDGAQREFIMQILANFKNPVIDPEAVNVTRFFDLCATYKAITAGENSYCGIFTNTSLERDLKHIEVDLSAAFSHTAVRKINHN